jgi:hypothetical protein
MYVIGMNPAGYAEPEFAPIEVEHARAALVTLTAQIRHDAPDHPIDHLREADIANGYRLTVDGATYWIEHRPAGDMPGIRITLPDTGYVIIAQAHRDDTEPTRAQIFIDAAARMDDAAALAHVQTELATLAQHAPCNVVHTWRLVHRTAVGDRELLAPAPVRGAGAALTDEGH